MLPIILPQRAWYFVEEYSSPSGSSVVLKIFLIIGIMFCMRIVVKSMQKRAVLLNSSILLGACNVILVTTKGKVFQFKKIRLVDMVKGIGSLLPLNVG